MPQPARCMAPFGHTIRARRCAPPNGRPRCPSSVLTWGREVTGDLAAAERREWLCVNGSGGFASGTIAGTQTRRYHGLLVAALDPPLGRRSEEHTSELQSRLHLVCRLLLEKKKNNVDSL